MRPRLGLNPTTPQNAAGRITDPLVCVPTAPGTMPQATPAADPIDDPPGVRRTSHGFFVCPGWKYASSVVTVFPTTIAPAASRLRTAPAEPVGTRPANSGDPCSVG